MNSTNKHCKMNESLAYIQHYEQAVFSIISQTSSSVSIKLQHHLSNEHVNCVSQKQNQ